MNFSGINRPVGAAKEAAEDPIATQLKSRLNNIRRAEAAQTAEAKQLKAAVQEFESYFLYILMKEMRKTVPETGMIHGGRAEEIFRDQLDQELTQQMAKTPGGIGIGQMLYEQLARPMLRPSGTDAATPVQGDAIPRRR